MNTVSKAKQLWVVKIGSALLSKGNTGVNLNLIASLSTQIATLREKNIDVIIVSSGAIACGMYRLGWSKRPHKLAELQSAAAVGQSDLIHTYQAQLQKHNIVTAQVLLTHDDLSNRTNYLNARSTIQQLLKLGAVPIVNENDTVVTSEICFGDNDTLGSLVTNLIEADLFVILTDQAGLFEKDPREHPEAKLINEAKCTEHSLDKICGPGKTDIGRGGMITKLKAARIAARSGTDTIIAGGHEANILVSLSDNKKNGTRLIAETSRLDAKKKWLISLPIKGVISLDEGACMALQQKGASLLPIGVQSIKGEFSRGDLICCIDSKGSELARGLVNYDADDCTKIIGLASKEFKELLSFDADNELIHRDNLVITN